MCPIGAGDLSRAAAKLATADAEMFGGLGGGAAGRAG